MHDVHVWTKGQRQMKIDVKIDTEGLKKKTLREQKRLAYSVSQALNQTAQEIQTEMRVELDKKFTVRKAQFMYRLIKIFTFANPRKDIPYAEVGIDNSKARTLLSLFDEGVTDSTRQPAVGRQIAVPLTGEAARVRFADPVADALTFKKLNLKPDAKQGGKPGWLFGNLHTYLVPGVGVFQRVSSVVSDLIYSFQKPMKLKKRLNLFRTAQQVFNREFYKRFNDAYKRGK
jgi:hypothetical protein